MKRYRMPMRFQGDSGAAGGGAGGGSAAGAAGGSGSAAGGGTGSSGDGGGAGDGAGDGDSGGAGNTEFHVLKRKLEKAERDKAKLEADLKAASDAKLSEEEKKRKDEIDAAYAKGISESEGKVKEAELRGEIRAAMSEYGIPGDLYDSFRLALGTDLEVADVATMAKALATKDGTVWSGFAASADGVRRPGPKAPHHKPAPKGFDGVDPWAPESWSVTEQAKLLRKDAALAQQLMERNGAKLGQVRPTPRPT